MVCRTLHLSCSAYCRSWGREKQKGRLGIMRRERNSTQRQEKGESCMPPCRGKCWKASHWLEHHSTTLGVYPSPERAELYPRDKDLDHGKEEAVQSPFLRALAQALGIVRFPVSRRKDQDPLSIRLQSYRFLFSVPPVFVRVGGFTLALFLSSLSTPGLSHIIV